MSSKKCENKNIQNAKVIQLGFNISVAGDEDFDILVEENKKENIIYCDNESKDHTQLQDFSNNPSKAEVERKDKSDFESNSKQSNSLEDANTSKVCSNLSDKQEFSGVKEFSLEKNIKKTMEHFEKFSDHIKEIPRFKISPIASSTPFQSQENSKSESNLYYPERRSRPLVNFYNFSSKKEFIRGKPLPSDLFLKPLPGADLYMRGMIRRYSYDPLIMYESVDSLTKPDDKCTSAFEKPSLYNEKYESDMPLEVPSKISKKKENESSEKSTSSPESVKDIKIYQNGGVLIMQNFNDKFGVPEGQEISNFSAKLIEDCNKLKGEKSRNNFEFKERPITNNSSEESQNSGKMVMFDLPDPAVENQTIHDFPSMSTQENDSIISTQPGMSPSASGKKLEWDSGADVGYLNLDLSKENLSTIERIVLKGLSNDNPLEKNTMLEKKLEDSYYDPSIIVPEKKFLEHITENTIDVKRCLEIRKSKINDLIAVNNNEQIKKTKEENTTDNGKELKNAHKFENNFKSIKKSKPKKLDVQISKAENIQNVERQNKVDKFINVNTLFPDNTCFEVTTKTLSKNGKSCMRSLFSSKSKASKVSPKSKKIKHKFTNQNIRTLNATPKEKHQSAKKRCDRADLVTFKMGIPKRAYKKVRAKPELSDFEHSKEVEEIIVDQSFRENEESIFRKKSIKNKSEKNENDEPYRKMEDEKCKTAVFECLTKTTTFNDQGNNLINSKQNKESVLVDQTIQTNNYQVESIGIQAFSCQVSSHCGSLNSKQAKPLCQYEDLPKSPKNKTNTSSKNIQVFGLNASLPKELAHLRENDSQKPLNTKSTQFFGGPINSLPNYHSFLITKPKESCGKMLKVLKSKDFESKAVNMVEENKKNIMANDNIQKIIDSKNSSLDKFSVPEDKENLMILKSAISEKHDSDLEQINLKESENIEANSHVIKYRKSNDNANDRKKSKRRLIDNQNTFPLDNTSYTVLTSKHLKEHGGNVDRKLIQEKYFHSQLVEIEKKRMISKSTFVDFDKKEYFSSVDKVDIGCQYSSSTETTTENSIDAVSYHESICDKQKGNRAPLEEHDSSIHLIQEKRNESSKSTNCEMGSSLTSSIQTANSSMLEVQNSGQNHINSAKRAGSFEYLPGHIYEKSGKVKENQADENNAREGTPSASFEADSMGTNRDRSSEGRKTLVLENSNESSWDSGRLKSLDENLTQLNVVVTRLKEKDSQIQKITRSVLVNLWRHNGSGDGAINLGETDIPDIKVKNKFHAEEKDADHDQKQKYVNANLPECNSGSSRNLRKSKNKKHEHEKRLLTSHEQKEKDSIACQTEAKSLECTLEKYQDERKALESRLAADKESQIKWIEKEIYHLNILRGLLEKRNSSLSQKKKFSSLTELSDDSQNYLKDQSKDISPEISVYPVYNHTNSFQKKNDTPSTEVNSFRKNDNGRQILTTPTSNSTKYGMAISLNGNLRKVTLIPDGVKVSVNNFESNKNHACEDFMKQKMKKQQSCNCPSTSQRTDRNQIMSYKHYQSDVETQTSFSEKLRCNQSWKSIQEVSPPQECSGCHQRNCVCLSLSQSEKTDRSLEIYSKCEGTSSETKESLKQGLESLIPVKYSNQNTISNSTDIETVNTESLSKRNKKCKKATESPQNYVVVNNPAKNLACKCETRPKSSMGACHVIKILGPTCCSLSEKNKCFCERKSVKKTENQFCQTDDVVIENKILVLNSEVVKPNKGTEIICPAENKIAIERKQSLDEKYLCNSKIPQEKLQPEERKLEVKDDNLESEASTTIKTPILTRACDCQKKKVNERSANGHPRHYFLKIEETEVDEINESVERRRSIEVITVKVPVKRAGKAKIYGNDLREEPSTQQNRMEPLKLKQNDCISCKNCLENRSATVSKNSTELRNDCQKLNADKSNYYPKTNKNHQKFIDYKSGDEMEYCSDKISTIDRCNPSYFARNGFDEDKQNLVGIESHGAKQGVSESSVSDCYSKDELRSFFKETPSDYDSHKECTSKMLRCVENNSDKRNHPHIYNGIKHFEAEEPFEKATDSRTFSKPRKFLPESQKYDSDYYNYNRKEFMTKSELLREEQMKKKIHQPSLQEYLESNRPDFCNSAESRRRIISERAKERIKNHGNRMECIMNVLHQCNNKNEESKKDGGAKRIFTTSQMREQTMKKYKQLPEVTEKKADQKKKEECRTNKLMADIFAKKLQLEALKGHINLSNSVSVLSMI